MSTVKEATLDPTKTIFLIENFFKQFEIACNRQTDPAIEEFKNLIADNFQITSNNKLVAKNRSEYLQKIKNFQKKYSQVKISALLEEPIFSGNKVVIRYDGDLISREQQKNLQVNIIAIVTTDHQLLTSWTQISHVTGRDEWDA